MNRTKQGGNSCSDGKAERTPILPIAVHSLVQKSERVDGSIGRWISGSGNKFQTWDIMDFPEVS